MSACSYFLCSTFPHLLPSLSLSITFFLKGGLPARELLMIHNKAFPTTQLLNTLSTHPRTHLPSSTSYLYSTSINSIIYIRLMVWSSEPALPKIYFTHIRTSSCSLSYVNSWMSSLINIILFLTARGGFFTDTIYLFASNISCNVSLLPIVCAFSLAKSKFQNWLKKANHYIIISVQISFHNPLFLLYSIFSSILINVQVLA